MDVVRCRRQQNITMGAAVDPNSRIFQAAGVVVTVPVEGMLTIGFRVGLISVIQSGTARYSWPAGWNFDVRLSDGSVYWLPLAPGSSSYYNFNDKDNQLYRMIDRPVNVAEVEVDSLIYAAEPLMTSDFLGFFYVDLLMIAAKDQAKYKFGKYGF